MINFALTVINFILFGPVYRQNGFSQKINLSQKNVCTLDLIYIQMNERI